MGEDEGVEMIRKLSERWTTNGMLWLLDRMQQRASDRVSKSLGLLLQPIVSHCKVIRTSPEVRVNLPCNGMVDGGVVKGEVFAWNQAINVGDGTAVGC